MTPLEINRSLVEAVGDLSFAPPVTHVYNPLVYARRSSEAYLDRFARHGVEAFWLGMNPGPFGMAQTGVPFGEVGLAREWLGLEAPVDRPEEEHPKRPIQGFACKRSEVSGARLWGWARESSERPRRSSRGSSSGTTAPWSSSRSPARTGRPTSYPRPSARRCSRPATWRSGRWWSAWLPAGSSAWASSQPTGHGPFSARAAPPSRPYSTPRRRAPSRTVAGLRRPNDSWRRWESSSPERPAPRRSLKESGEPVRGWARRCSSNPGSGPRSGHGLLEQARLPKASLHQLAEAGGTR